MPQTPPNKLTVAVVGATGAVGRTMVQVLLEKRFPYTELRLLASERSAGRTVDVGGRDPDHRPGDAGGVRGRRHRAVLRGRRHLQGARPRGREARRRGHRQLERLADGPVGPARRVAGQPRRPRVARGHHREPQLLDDAARAAADGAPRQRWASSGSSSTPTSPSAAPATRPSWSSRTRSRPTRRAGPRSPRVYPHPIAFNALPHIDVFLDNGYTKEEWKVVTESRKILHLPDLRLSCTAVRVPVFVSHSEAVHVETRRPDHARPRPARCSPA